MTNNENTELKSYKPYFENFGIDGDMFYVLHGHNLHVGESYFARTLGDIRAYCSNEFDRQEDYENLPDTTTPEVFRVILEIQCADDLEAELEDRWGHESEIHPALMHKFKRDMSSALAARKAFKLTIDDVEGE